MHPEVAGFIQEQQEVNARHVEINEGLAITQACIETLLAHMLPTGESGRDALPAEPPATMVRIRFVTVAPQ